MQLGEPTTVVQQSIVCAARVGAGRERAAKERLLPRSPGSLGIICMFNCVRDSLCVMVNRTNCRWGEFGVWGGGGLGERCAQSRCLFHHLAVIPVPRGLERRVRTSLGSPREGKDFPVQRMMTGKRGNPSVYGSAKSVPGKRQEAAPTSPLCLRLLQTRVSGWMRIQTARVVQMLNIKDQILLH